MEVNLFIILVATTTNFQCFALNLRERQTEEGVSFECPPDISQTSSTANQGENKGGRKEIELKLMQFTMFDDSLQSFSNSKNDSSITLWDSSITDDL